MARRGTNSFRRNDGLRALQIARDSGLEPIAMEIVVGADGAVIFRIYNEKAVGLIPTPGEDASKSGFAELKSRRGTL